MLYQKILDKNTSCRQYKTWSAMTSLGRINCMQKVEYQQKFHQIIDLLPDNKLHEIIEFAQYMINQNTSEERLRVQMSSTAYQEWLLPENDIYDELFKDDVE